MPCRQHEPTTCICMAAFNILTWLYMPHKSIIREKNYWPQAREEKMAEHFDEHLNEETLQRWINLEGLWWVQYPTAWYIPSSIVSASVVVWLCIHKGPWSFTTLRAQWKWNMLCCSRFRGFIYLTSSCLEGIDNILLNYHTKYWEVSLHVDLFIDWLINR